MRVMVIRAMLVGCVWVSWWPACCVCFSQGANSASCADMKPGHISTQPHHTPTRSAVSVHTSRTIYLPQHTLMVSVRSSRAFMGLLLQARSVLEDRVVGGEFTVNPPGTHTLSCISTADTVTHSDKLLKRNLSFIWRAPAQPSGDMRFYITVVHSYFVYWSRIRSAVVQDGTRRTQNVGLQTRIISESLMKSTKIHTSSDTHLLNSTQYSIHYENTLTNKSSPHTLPPQYKHITQLSPTYSHTGGERDSKVTRDTIWPSNTTLQSCTLANHVTHTLDDTKNDSERHSTLQAVMKSTVHFDPATHTSAPQTHTSAQTLHKHTPTHTRLFKHFLTRLHSHTMSDTHITSLSAIMGPGPQAHVPTLKPHLQTNRYETTASTHTQKMPYNVNRPPPVTLHTRTYSTSRSHMLTPLRTHKHVDRITKLTAHAPATLIHPVGASAVVSTDAHSSQSIEAITVPYTYTDTPSSHSSTATSFSVPTLTLHSASTSVSIPTAIPTSNPSPTPNSLPTLIPTLSSVSIPTPTSSLASNPTSGPTSTSTSIPNSTSAPMPNPTSVLILTVPTTTTSIEDSNIFPIATPPSIPASIISSIPNQTSNPSPNSIQNSALTSTPVPFLTSLLRPSLVSAPTQISTSSANPVPVYTSTSTPTPTQTSTPTSFPNPASISNSDLIPTPTSITGTHTSFLPSSPHPDPSPALQYSLFDPLPPRESRDKPYSHAKEEEASSELKPSQRPRELPKSPDGKVLKPELVPRQNASELGLLLVGLSAGLGMAVAVGLRYLQRKHCRRHTAVSLGDRSHGNRSVIHVQECGDLVQVRRIRENSFLLLQAEYNLITAPGS